MPRRDLAEVTTFADLVRYLRDELDWPINEGSFDESSFDYSAEEIGLNPSTAAKVSRIKQLRPMTANQPWGVFFVEFERTQLPVIALRRILNGLALKKRASANPADRAAWKADDLIFISSYGESAQRQLNFAHFASNDNRSGRATLRVLGWDGRDTPLHLRSVTATLAESLAWPNDESDVEGWRRQWLAAFTLRHREVVTTSRDLSVRLAELARSIRDRIGAALSVESDEGPLTQLMSAFRVALIHDLDADGFADMYAQTIAYGLLSARVVSPSGNRVSDSIGLPVANPFLRELMETFVHVADDGHSSKLAALDFDELGVNDVVELLDLANMEAVVRDFGDRNPLEDPVIHFYELFLKEYDPKRRMQRGVFYTPRPIVSYIVRAVDELVRTEFGLEDGLADTTTWGEMVKRRVLLDIPNGVDPSRPFVTILDPATGTGTFLVETIDLIHRRMTSNWAARGESTNTIEELWNDYVPNHLLPRLHGFELMMAPYAIAHLKIGLKLHETGYRFGSNERVRIYLTNALESAHDLSGAFEFALPALAHEARAVNQIKSDQRFTVVLGNPPYSKLSANLAAEQRELVDAFRYVDDNRIVERGALALEMNLQDDYVKFFRLAQLKVVEAGGGVIGLITNHGYLSTPTLRGMRWSLITSFPFARALDLHGHSGKGEKTPDGGKDENVFDIQQGVAVSFFWKTPTVIGGAPDVRVADLYGLRRHKYDVLLSTGIAETEWKEVDLKAPSYRFVPSAEAQQGEFETWTSVSDALSLSSDGIVTARDALVVAFSKSELLDRIAAFRDAPGSGREVCGRFGIAAESAGFKVDEVLKVLRAVPDLSDHILRIQYRPFDYRYLYYFRGLIQSMRWPVTSQLSARGNALLAVTRQVNRPTYEHAFVSRFMVEKKAVSHDRNTQVFPILVTPGDGALLDPDDAHGNWSEQFSREWLHLTGTDPRQREFAFAPLYYIYAILHSPTYRRQYFSYLRSEFPRLPLPRGTAVLEPLLEIGRELVGLHTMESPAVERLITTYTGQHDPEVGRVSWANGSVWLDSGSTSGSGAGGTVGFRGVPEAVWNFHIGGYQVCHKWLKDRKGRRLSTDELRHYSRMVSALSATIVRMEEVDAVVDSHGGWSTAFVDARTV